MKKLYFLVFIFFVAFANNSNGQTAANTGNWSSNGTWAPGTKPANPCTNCTIVIKTGKTVTLDQSVVLKGATTLYIQTGATLKITSSEQFSRRGSLQNGHNILMDAAGSSKIILEGTGTIDASATFGTAGRGGRPNTGPGGYYDGVFSSDFPSASSVNPSVSTKVIGNSIPTFYIGNFPVSGPTSQPTKNSITGPGTLSSTGILPVTLTSFSAVLNDDAVNLSWTVDQQIDFDHFEVLHSSDGGTWQSLGNVSALPTKGVANYSFVDEAPVHGLNYYRLRAVDIDGNFKLSDVELVRGSLIKGVLFANPVRNGSLTVSFGTDIKSNLAVRLLNTNGQIIQQRQVNNPAGSTITLSVGTYAKGVYLLHIRADDGSEKIYKVVVSN